MVPDRGVPRGFHLFRTLFYYMPQASQTDRMDSEAASSGILHRTSRPAPDAMNLEDRFQVSRTLGFLPPPLPVRFVDEQYYTPWLELAREGNLADLLGSDSLDARIRNLPVLQANRLHDINEWRRAHSVLAFLVAAWVWGGSSGPKDVSDCFD